MLDYSLALPWDGALFEQTYKCFKEEENEWSAKNA